MNLTISPWLTMSNLRQEFVDLLEAEKFVVDKTGTKLLELTGVSFLASEPTIFGRVNHGYVERELAWYKSMSLNVNDIPGSTPEIWKQVATPDGRINSNYGYLIFSTENGYQYENVLAELTRSPTSRRAVMIYTRPSMHYDYNRDGMSDFCCTNAVQYMIRDNHLDAIVQMRSNDVHYGYRNDWAWQKYVQNKLSADLGVRPGILIWQVGSLHLYERDFWRVDCWSKFKDHLSEREYNELCAGISTGN
jgi:thymidylate synthase